MNVALMPVPIETFGIGMQLKVAPDKGGTNFSKARVKFIPIITIWRQQQKIDCALISD